ncbi:Plastocyanin-like protein [Corchorus capsularis]|uniref:Plastocyanin-like protein n=1 Tax=Corchorus capsularis TaxID=210143 RepID=A0A1R3IEW7_COCAP|nr:Plastocyanin-like protein [Corchorus capsularis]
MARKFSMVAAVFVAVLGVAAMFQGTSAVTYTVGDATGWRIPTNTDFYDDWNDNKVFHVGDILIFNFTTGAHDVAEVKTENAYDTCATAAANLVSTITTGPASITLNRTGDHYFICTFGTHCASGQKVQIEVEMGTSPPSTTPPTSPTPGSSPTPTTPTTPSGTNTTTSTTPSTTTPSSASSLVSTLSLVFVSIALVLFF